MDGQIHVVTAAFSVQVVQLQVQGTTFSAQPVLPAQTMPAALPDSHTQSSNKRSRSKRQFFLVIVIVVTMMNGLTRFVQLVGWIRSVLFFFFFLVSLIYPILWSSSSLCQYILWTLSRENLRFSILTLDLVVLYSCHFLWKTAKESTWQSRWLRLPMKFQVYRAVVVPTLLYSAVPLLEADKATWPVLLAPILGIKWQDYMSNEEALKRTSQPSREFVLLQVQLR